MKNGLVIKKSPIGQEDMFFGRRVQQQERAGGLYDISGVVMVYPVNTLDELKNLDPKKYDTAFLVGSGVINTTPDGQPVILDGNNEFYYFDFTSSEPEDIPNVIESNVSLAGRWKIAKVGENRILQIVKAELTKRTESIKEEITTQVKTELSGLTALEREGGVYDETLEYQTNQFVRAFVKTEKGVESRLYMANEDAVSESPIDGTLFSEQNGIKIYNDTGLTESSKYNRLIHTNSNVYRVNLQANKTFKFLGGGTIPRGKLKCSVFKGNSVTAYFEIIFSGTSISDFIIRNVMYANSIKSTTISISYGYIFYPGFAIFCDGINFGISVDKITQADYIEFDYSEFNQSPTLQITTFSSANCYAIREGGGSYIPNIGMTYYNMRKQGSSSNAESEDFYTFMSGTVAWTYAMNIDETLYHQYVAACVLPTMDNDGKFVRNLGGNAAATIGGVQQESLPNIKGLTGNTSEDDQSGRALASMNMSGEAYRADGCSMRNGWSGALYAVGKKPNDVGFPEGTAFYATEQSVADGHWYQLYLGFDASRSSSVYQDGGHVTPESMTRQDRLQLF